MVALAVLAGRAASYGKYIKPAMRAGYSMAEAAKIWREHHAVKKEKKKMHSRRIHHAQTKKIQGENMAKRGKHKGHRRGSTGEGKMGLSSLAKNSAMIFGSGIAALAVMDQVSASQAPEGSTKPDLVKNATDRIQGALNKIGKSQYLAPIVAGAIVSTGKVPMLKGATAKMVALGLIGAPLIMAATTPGSPGTPVYGYTTSRTGSISAKRIVGGSIQATPQMELF